MFSVILLTQHKHTVLIRSKLHFYIVMIIVAIQSVVILSVVILSVIMLSVIMLSVVMLSVVASFVIFQQRIPL